MENHKHKRFNRTTGLILFSTIVLGFAGTVATDYSAVVQAVETKQSQQAATKKATQAAKKKAAAEEKKTIEKVLRGGDDQSSSLVADGSLGRISDQLKSRGVNTKKLSLAQAQKKEVRVIVSLKGKSALEKNDNQVQSTRSANQAEEKVLAKQDSTQAKAEKLTGNKVQQEFGYLLNGFSIDAKVSDLNALRALPNVKAVEVAGVAEKEDVSADKTVQAQTAWGTYGVKGEGMVVSVIDSGAHTHKDLRLSDSTTAKISKEDSAKFTKEVGYGTYINEKIPFAHDYSAANDDETWDTGTEMHGQHVTGIIAANGENPDGMTSVQGVAPEAQILDMKVFPDDNGQQGPTTDAIIQAIEDSVELGADVINMSLGSSDYTNGTPDAESEAINRAAAAGVVPVIAAGNDGNANWLGKPDREDKVLGDNPDGGLMSTPANAKYAITVASSENTNEITTTMDVTKDGAAALDAKAQVQASASVLKTGELSGQIVALPDKSTKDATGAAVDPVAAGLPGRGFQTDFDGEDVSGKIVLVSRGINYFTEKMSNAEAAGAKAIIVMNNEDAMINAEITGGSNIPTLFVDKATGLALMKDIAAEPDANFAFSNIGRGTFPNADYGTMSEYSTWGPNTDLSAKPDITAPGGHLWSLTNTDYQDMSGTSMATPVVSGSEALILQSFQTTAKNLTGLDKVLAAKLTAQNTSVPVIDHKHADAPYSPRLQGAGEIRIGDAIRNTVTLDYEGEGAAALREISDRTQTIKLTLTNNGTESQTYDFNDFGGVYTGSVDETGLLNDKKIDGATLTTTDNEITVPAGEKKTVTVTMTLPDDFKTSQWAEGFIGFDAKGDQPSLSIPLTAFFGDWDMKVTPSSMRRRGTRAPS